MKQDQSVKAPQPATSNTDKEIKKVRSEISDLKRKIEEETKDIEKMKALIQIY